MILWKNQVGSMNLAGHDFLPVFFSELTGDKTFGVGTKFIMHEMYSRNHQAKQTMSLSLSMKEFES